VPKDIFSSLKAQIVDIYCNMAILMVDLEKKIVPFREFGSSNLESILYRKSINNEDLEKNPKMELEKEISSCSAITSSQYLFKLESKVEIKNYQGEIGIVNFNQWLQ
jgi:hypothetical protein